VVVVLLLLELEFRGGTFFLVFFSFFWLYAFVLPLWYCVVAEADCNWYLSILIYFLYRKKTREGGLTKSARGDCELGFI
jgi:membrane protein implicated in regulation of membrane protease activity